MPALAQFDSMVVLGASSQDDGFQSLALKDPDYVGNSPPYDNGRWSDGFIPAEYLAEILGLDYASDVENYAIGGATTSSDLPGSFQFDDKNLFHPVTGGLAGQFGRYLENNPGDINPDTLFLFAFGGNDISADRGNQISQPNYSATMDNLRLATHELMDRGARNFVFANPDPLVSILFIGLEGNWPGYTQESVDAYILAARQFNQELSALVAELASEQELDNVVLYDHALFVEMVRDDPAAFGFDALEACYRPWIPYMCESPETTLYWDVVHLTTAANQLEAQYVGSTLLATRSTMPNMDLAHLSGSVINQQIIGHVSKRRASLAADGNIQLASTGHVPNVLPSKRQGWQAFVLGEYLTANQSASGVEAGYDAQFSAGSIGFEHHGPESLLGFAAGLYSSNGDIDGGSRSEISGYNLAGFANLMHNDWIFSGSIWASFFDMDTSRQTGFLGSVASADDVDGRQFGGSAWIGYPVNVGASARFTPMLGVLSSKTKLESYSESGAIEGLNLTVPEQELLTLSSQFGGEISFHREGSRSSIEPRLHAYWVHEFEDDARSTRHGIVSNPSLLTGVTEDPDRDYGRLGFGLNLSIAKNINIDLSYDTTIFRKDYEEHQGNLKLSFGF